jgi:hypothetical protein
MIYTLSPATQSVSTIGEISERPAGPYPSFLQILGLWADPNANVLYAAAATERLSGGFSTETTLIGYRVSRSGPFSVKLSEMNIGNRPQSMTFSRQSGCRYLLYADSNSIIRLSKRPYYDVFSLTNLGIYDALWIKADPKGDNLFVGDGRIGLVEIHLDGRGKPEQSTIVLKGTLPQGIAFY